MSSLVGLPDSPTLSSFLPGLPPSPPKQSNNKENSSDSATKNHWRLVCVGMVSSQAPYPTVQQEKPKSSAKPCTDHEL